MRFNSAKVVVLMVLVSFLLVGLGSAFAENDPAAKTAPEGVRGKYHSYNLATTDFLFESFESWYPAGWDQIITNGNYTWYQGNLDPYDGAADAMIEYDPALVPQSEWMISPSIDLTGTSEITLDFWFLTSYYWFVDPYDNADMEVRVSTDDGDTWSDPIWTENDYGEFENWTWYNVTLDLSAYAGETNFKIALVYEGTDGAQADFDAVLLSGEQQLDHDVAAVEFLSPDETGDAGTAITPQVSFRNFGANNETFDANMTIEVGGNEVYNETLTGLSLTAGSTDDFSFPEYTPTLEDTYTLTVTANLGGDERPGNNTLAMDYITTPITVYEYDFEDGESGFSGDNDWQWGEPTTGPGGGHSGTCVFGTLINGEYTEGPLLSSLVCPEVEIGSQAIFTFWHYYDTESSYDGGNVKISTNGGSTWALLQPQGGYDGALSTSYENPIGGEEAFYGTNSGWTMETFDLSAYADESIMIKFDFGSDNSVVGGDGWYIDDFRIEFYGGTVGIDDNGAALPTAMKLDQNYPNPFNARTEIRFNLASETTVDLSIFNLLGEKVATLASGKMAAGTHSVNWDASNVGSGVYFYRLTAEGKSETRQLTLIK